MADTDFMDSPVMKEHFAQAGIVDEPTTTGTGDGTSSTADKTADTTDATGTTGTTETTTTTTGDADKSGTTGDKQGVAGQAGAGDKADSGTKQGSEAKPAQVAGPKDLTLPDGTIVKGGVERRWFENAQLARQQAAAAIDRATTAEQSVAAMQREVDTHKAALTAMGATDAQTAHNALRLFNDLKTNPVLAISNLLAEIKALGHNIEGIGSHVDTMAIKSMLARSGLGAEQQTVTLSPQQIEAQAEQETGTFFGRYPDAVIHDAVLADIITKHPNASLEDAYFQLKHAAINQGFDWSQPLAPQVAARGQAATTTASQGQRPAPLVNGRGGDSAINPIAPHDEPQGETFDDIIRSAMRETGYLKN